MKDEAKEAVTGSFQDGMGKMKQAENQGRSRSSNRSLETASKSTTANLMAMLATMATKEEKKKKKSNSKEEAITQQRRR